MRDEAAAPASKTATSRGPGALAQGHIGVLDGVRGLAILMVLVLHFIGNATPTNRFEKLVVAAAGFGQYGVDLFFVLSGFLITGILFDTREKPSFFKNFYMRRLLRIFPLYYGVLVVLFFVLPHIPWFQGPELDTIVRHQAWAWLYGVNVFNALHDDWALPYIDHFWSLAVEEHFYFVWPLVVWLLGKRPRTLMLASLAVAAGALVARIACSVAGVSQHALYVLTPFRLDGLALGGFLAIVARQPGGLDKIAKALPRVAIGTLLLFIARVAWTRTVGIGTLVLRPIRESLVMLVLACVLMAAVTAPPRSVWARIFTSRPLTFLGTYSYGLYVYHHFFSYYAATHGTEFALAKLLHTHAGAVIAQSLVGVSLSVVAAMVSYEFFEKRFLSLKSRFESSRRVAH